MSTPILWYKFNEDSANIGTDYSGNGTDITNVGVVSTIDSTYGQVADFSGGTLTLPAASVPSALRGTSSRTYSFWIESNVDANTQIIDIGTRTTGVGTDWGTAINGNGKIGQSLFNTSGITGATSMTAGVWYHVVLTFEDAGNLLSIYLNGSLDVADYRTVNTGNTDLEFGETGSQDMRLLDMRIYDVAIDATEVSTLFSNGPFVPIKAEIYSHVVDLTWDAVSGASTYTITQMVDSGSEETVIDGSTELLQTLPVEPGSSYVFSMYTDLDLVTALGQAIVTAPSIDATSVGNMMVRFNNDLTQISEIYGEDVVDDIDQNLRDVLSTGEVINTNIGEVTFVQESEELEISSVYHNVLTSFETTDLVGKTSDIRLPDDSVNTLTYDESAVTVNGAQVGDYFILGSYRVRVANL